MSKKDYEAFARMLRNCNISNAGKKKAILNLVEDIVEYFENNNERFDRTRFVAACFSK